MYVPPRPKAEEDPYFATRLGLMGSFALIAAYFLQPDIPTLLVIFPCTLMAGQRRAFEPMRFTVTIVAMIALTWIFATLVMFTHATPLLLLLTMYLAFTGAFYITRSSGNPLGMIILIIASMLSVAGMKSPELMLTFARNLSVALLVALVGLMLLYGLFPAKTKQPLVQNMQGIDNYVLEGALIRAAVLLGLCFWLYAVLPVSDVILAIAAVFVLMFPTRERALAEALQRTLATVYGAAAAVLVLLLLSANGEFILAPVIMTLAGLFFGHLMVTGKAPAPVYQYAYSVMATLVITAITTQSPGNAVLMRVTLTIAGALVAMLLSVSLEACLLNNKPHTKTGASEP